jgi:hypothetical protein
MRHNQLARRIKVTGSLEAGTQILFFLYAQYRKLVDRLNVSFQTASIGGKVDCQTFIHYEDVSGKVNFAKFLSPY